jgi:cytochrome P450
MEMHSNDEFSLAFDYASGITAERFQNPLWRVTELFTGSRFRRSVSVVKNFGHRIVASAVKDRNEQHSKHETTGASNEDSKLNDISGSLVQSLLDALGNEETVADAALTYLSAGRDTTGQALTWTFYLLLQHPSAVAKVRAEVQHLLSQQQPPSTKIDTRLFTPHALPYTTAIFHEALRLFPPIPFEIRQCQADTALPDGTLLPRGSVLVWCLWAMQRSRATWGEDAGEFKPERFLVDDIRESGEVGGKKFVQGKTAAEFPVFYGGARACLGKKMAEAIAVQVIPAVVWGFEVEKGWDGPMEGRRSQTSLTLPMEGGLPVRVRVRAGGDE